MSVDTGTEPEAPTARRGVSRVLVVGLLLAFVVAGFLSGYASSSPDGLEKVAGDQGFLESSRDSAASGSPLADYALKGIEDERLAGGLAGVIGVVLAIVVGTVVFYAVSRVSRRRSGTPSAGSV